MTSRLFFFFLLISSVIPRSHDDSAVISSCFYRIPKRQRVDFIIFVHCTHEESILIFTTSPSGGFLSCGVSMDGFKNPQGHGSSLSLVML